MKEITRKLLAIALVVALVLTCALAEAESSADVDLYALYDEGFDAFEAGDYETALEKFTQGAEAGYSTSQYMLGIMYEVGNGVEQDYAKAMEWYLKAAEQNDEAAQYNLGCLYEDGLGVDVDLDEARKWYQRALDNGNEYAAEALARLDGEGGDSEAPAEEAASTEEEAPAAGEVDAGLVAQYEEGIEAYRNADFDIALEMIAPVAEAGYGPAQTRMGIMYYNGYGVEQDYAQAAEWLTKGANQGDTLAQTYLGGMYVQGIGVPRDDMMAMQWYEKAAEQGDATGQYNLGLMYYFDDMGPAQDYAKALELFTRAAEQEYGSAQYFLGLMYANGQGVEADVDLAREWLQRAVDNGDQRAPEALASLESTGSADLGMKDPEGVKQVQSLLNILGYNCGTPDGVIGKKTEEAVRKFQEDNGLKVTGTITQEMYNTLLGIFQSMISTN